MELNVGKTREMITDFRSKSDHPDPVVIRGKAIEQAATYKYLDIHFDCKLSWKQNTGAVNS